MHTQKVGSPRSTDSPRRLPDHGAAPLSPRTSTPRVLQKEYDALRLSLSRSDSLCAPVFDVGSFIDTMKPAIAKECARAGLPARAERLQETAAQISNALGQVDTFYEKDDFVNCHTYLTAAKGNQVSLLAAIDALKQDPDGDQGFSEAHDQCAQLGHKIAALMHLVIEKSSRQPYPQQQQPLTSPRPSSPKLVSSPERQKNQKTKRADAAPLPSASAGHAPCSPEPGAGRGQLEKLPSPSPGKRVQGDEDSPRMKNSTAKRQKTEAAAQTAPMPAQAGCVVTNASLRQAGTLSPRRPGSPIKVPGLDWSSAKPVNTGPHSPLGTTPRAARPTRTEGNGTGKQGADAARSLPSAPANEGRRGTDGNEPPSPLPASPPPAQSLASPDSPRRQLFSPTKALKAQPRPRPPSMLFTSPPVPSRPADSMDEAAKKTRDIDRDVAASQMPQSMPTSLGNPRTADDIAVAKSVQETADI